MFMNIEIAKFKSELDKFIKISESGAVVKSYQKVLIFSKFLLISKTHQ